MWETQVQSLGWEDPLEKEMATHTLVLLPRKFHGRRSLVGYSSWGRKESDMTLNISYKNYSFVIYFIILQIHTLLKII